MGRLYSDGKRVRYQEMGKTMKPEKKIISQILILLFFLTLSTTVSLAQEAEKEKKSDFKSSLEGYIKTLWVFQWEKHTKKGWTLNTNRLRLNFLEKYKKNLAVRIIYDLEAFTGNTVSTPEWDYLASNKQDIYWDLSTGSKTGNSVYIRHNIYRAYLFYDAGFAQFNVGKQRISWGAMRFWRPTDMFNQEDPLQIESGERLGVDGIDVLIPIKSTDIEYVYSPSKDPERYISTGKFHFTLGDYDFTMVGGRVRNNGVAGFTYNGYIGDGGFRGECLRVEPEKRDPYYLWTVGGDYSFPNTLTLTLEYMNNGGATGNPITPFIQERGIIQTMNRQFIGFGADTNINPLIKFQSFASYDIDGKSWAFSPRIVWDYKKNTTITLGGQVYSGGKGGEYSNTPGSVFTEVKLNF